VNEKVVTPFSFYKSKSFRKVKPFDSTLCHVGGYGKGYLKDTMEPSNEKERFSD